MTLSRRLFLPLLVCGLMTSVLFPATPAHMRPFQHLIVLEQGRKKPMDSYARNLLRQFSGRSVVAGMDACTWLSRVLFIPWETHDDRIFLVNHADVLTAMGLDLSGRGRYSYRQLLPGLDKLQEMAGQVSRLQEQNRGAIENEFLRLFFSVSQYYQLQKSFHFAWSGEVAGSAPSIRASAPAIIPLFSDGHEHWLSPAEASGKERELPAAVRGELSLLRQAAQAFAHQRWHDFEKSVSGFNRSVRNRLPSGEPTAGRIALEVHVNQLELLNKAKLAYGLVLGVLLLSVLFWRGRLVRLSLLLLLAGLAAHTLAVVARMGIMGRPPVTNLYETFVFVSWVSVVIGLVLEWFQKKGLGLLSGGLAGLVFLLIAGRYSLEGDTMGMLAAVLDSNLWLATHVATIALGYAGCVVAGIIGHVYLIHCLLPGGSPASRERTGRSLYAILAFGMAFTAIGTIMGGIWADQSWGRFWGWDPKENGALLIIIWCAILFHARLLGWIGQTGLAAGAVGAIVAVALTWFGVNLLGLGMHAYGFMSGVSRALAVFVVCELLFVMIAMWLIKKNDRQ